MILYNEIEYMTVAEFSATAGLAESTVRPYMTEGKISHIKIGTGTFIPASEVEKFKKKEGKS